MIPRQPFIGSFGCYCLEAGNAYFGVLRRLEHLLIVNNSREAIILEAL